MIFLILLKSMPTYLYIGKHTQMYVRDDLYVACLCMCMIKHLPLY